MSHEVEFKIPAHTVELGGRDVVFKAYDDGRLIGTLMISLGGIEWRSAKHQYVATADWDRFDDVATRSLREQKKPTPRTRRQRRKASTRRRKR